MVKFWSVINGGKIHLRFQISMLKISDTRVQIGSRIGPYINKSVIVRVRFLQHF